MIEPRAEPFEASDGYPIHVLRWSPEGTETRAQVVILHGVQSHAGWYYNLGRRLAEAGSGSVFSGPDEGLGRTGRSEDMRRRTEDC